MTTNLSAMKVVIDDIVYHKIMHWVDKSPVECSGLGKVVVEDGIIKVVDAILLPQVNTAVTTDIDPIHVGKAMFQLKDAEGELRFWWHSHANMGVFWSGIDTSTINTLSQGGWFVSTVFNKKRETKTCVKVVDPFEFIVDDVTLEITKRIDPATLESWNIQYKVNVEDHMKKLLEEREAATKAALAARGYTNHERSYQNHLFDNRGVYQGGKTQQFGNWMNGMDHDDSPWNGYLNDDPIPPQQQAHAPRSVSVHEFSEQQVARMQAERERLEAELEDIESVFDTWEEMGLITQEERNDTE